MNHKSLFCLHFLYTIEEYFAGQFYLPSLVHNNKLNNLCMYFPIIQVNISVDSIGRKINKEIKCWNAPYLFI